MTMRILTAGDPAHARACGHVLAPDTALALSETGSASLIDLSGAVHALTPVAAEMVARTLETGRDAAIAALAESYDAAPERIAADLDKLWSNLIARGLIQRAGEPARRRCAAPAATICAWLTDHALGLPLPFAMRAAMMLAFARLSCRYAGLAATAEAWRRRFGTGGQADAEMIAEEARIIHATATRHWLRVDCKERALTAWAAARRKGVDATVVIGLRLYPLGGHAWCRVGDRIIADSPEFCAAHKPILEYGKA